MTAIFKRELRAYFRTPLGYVLVAAMYFFTGYYYYTYNLYNGTSNMTVLFTQLFSVVLFLVPVLTMRLMSEDKRSRTDQVLLTAPVRRSGIVVGKYLAAMAVYLIAISGTLLVTIVTEYYTSPDWPVIIGNFTGLLLLGTALVAVGMFLSSLTESQVIAAVISFAVSLVLMLVDAFSFVTTDTSLQKILTFMSFNNRYKPFTYGILDISNTLFFISFAALFLFLTSAVLEKRRWS
jgi:ABC-2 type transport system permease protein